MTIGTDEEGVPEIFVGEQLLHHGVLGLEERAVHYSTPLINSTINQSSDFFYLKNIYTEYVNNTVSISVPQSNWILQFSGRIPIFLTSLNI